MGAQNIANGSAALEPDFSANTINTTWYSNGEQLTGNNIPGTCRYDAALTPPTPAPRAGYTFAGWRLKRCEVPSSIISDNSGYTGYEPMIEWSGIGSIQFDRKCSATNGTQGVAGTPSNTNGRYCWCAAIAWTPDGGNQCMFASPSWVFNYADDDFGECETYCSSLRCTYSFLDGNSELRTLMLGNNVAE